MKKILVVIQLVRRGGVELVAINFAKSLSPTMFDITFLLINPDEHQDEALVQELVSNGYKIISVPKSANSYLKKYRFLNDLFEREKFDVVHSHVMFFSGFVLRAAKKNGVKIRASHSHAIKWNSRENLPYKIYKHIMRLVLNRNANYKLACSRAAGEFLYGKKQYEKNGRFIANGIDTKSFAYDEKIRAEVRKELGICENELLVGHIGTIYRIKNQTFLVKIFAQMLSKNPNIKLLLVGETVDTQPVIDVANQLNVLDKIIFAGQRSDINKIYQAMDIMIFPSLHEALPVSLIEAQASKLPCLISDTVTKEVKFNSNVNFMSLDKSEEDWALKAFDMINTDRNAVDTEKLISTYDIHTVTGELESIYCS